jgi:multidrug efflux pump
MWLYKIKLYQWTQDFQHNFFLEWKKKYKVFLAKILTGKNAWFALEIIIMLFFVHFIGNFPKKSIVFP